jgi:hypothetical protein
MHYNALEIAQIDHIFIPLQCMALLGNLKWVSHRVDSNIESYKDFHLDLQNP